MATEEKDSNSKLENVEVALTKGEQFIEKNQKKLSIIAIGILALVLGIYAANRFYLIPLDEKAQSQIFMAEQNFAKDSFELALTGDGNFPGFLEIIDEYAITKTANLAQYYSGISFLRTGKYEESIENLKSFSCSDPLLEPIKYGAMGDAYSELGDNENALKNYFKAINVSKNELTSPIYIMKAAQLLESLERYTEAIDLYTKIKLEYRKSEEMREIEKYISRAQVRAGIQID